MVSLRVRVAVASFCEWQLEIAVVTCWLGWRKTVLRNDFLVQYHTDGQPLSKRNCFMVSLRVRVAVASFCDWQLEIAVVTCWLGWTET